MKREILRRQCWRQSPRCPIPVPRARCVGPGLLILGHHIREEPVRYESPAHRRTSRSSREESLEQSPAAGLPCDPESSRRAVALLGQTDGRRLSTPAVVASAWYTDRYREESWPVLSAVASVRFVLFLHRGSQDRQLYRYALRNE